MFQDEFKLFLALSVPIRHEIASLCQYVITKPKHKGSWRVSFNRVSTSIACSCRKFEAFGILCSHALKVFQLNDVKVIPDMYILRRWTKEARYGIVQDFMGNEVEGDPKSSRNRMYRQVVSKFIRAAVEASNDEESLKFVDKSVDDMLKKMMESRAQAMDKNGENGARTTIMSSDPMQAKGFKNRPGSKRTNRIKSCLEKQHSRAPPKERSAQVWLSSKVFMLAQFCVNNIGYIINKISLF